MDTLRDESSYALSPWSAEFRNPATETAFRAHIRPFWVRDTRRAFTMAALFYLAFAITDFMLLGAGVQYEIVFFTRFIVTLCGLLIAFTAERYWRLLVDGITPSLVVGLAMAGFMSITLLRPLDVGWHGMSMMVMLLGTYAFIPNRFLPILTLAGLSTLAFFILLLDHFEMPLNEVVVMGLLFFGMNMFGATSAYRISRLTRENFRDALILRQANTRLSEEVAARMKLEQELIAQVHQDELTGAMNRRRFNELALRRLAGFPLDGKPLSLLLLNVDYFKQLKDTYGHVRADEILRALVRLCQTHTGGEDLFGRVSGEEFALLAPGIDLEQARQLGEQIREDVWRSPIALADTAVHITVSIGVVQWRVGEGLSDLLRRADQALQAAKYNGHNQVVALAGDMPATDSTIRSAA